MFKVHFLFLKNIQQVTENIWKIVQTTPEIAVLQFL